MRRFLYPAAFALVFAAPALVAAGLPAAASPVDPSGNGSVSAARANMIAVRSAPWGHWSRTVGAAPGGVSAASDYSGLRDPLGDEIGDSGQAVNQPNADLVSASAEDNGTTVTFRAATAVLSDPYTDPAWGTPGAEESFGSTGPSWTLSSSSDPSSQPLGFVSLVSFGGELQAEVEITTNGSGESGLETPGTGCNGTPGFAPSGPNAGYSVSFPSSCLGQLGRFYWAVSMNYDPAGDTDESLQAGDQAPNSTPLPEVDVFPAAQGYWLAAADGGIFSHGSASFDGSEGGLPINAPIVAAAATPDGRGYFLVAGDGGVFNFGDAVFRGSIGARQLTSPIVAIVVTPDGGGYLLVAADGAVFSFGDAPILGSEAGLALTSPIVAVALTPDDSGYWLFAADGGVFNFGDASFYGTADTHPLNSPIVGAAVDSQTGGYWLAAADGGVFSFNAPFHGSEGGSHLNAPIVGIASAQNGAGYRLVAADGGLFDFAAAGFAGSQGGQHLNAPVVGAASVES